MTENTHAARKRSTGARVSLLLAATVTGLLAIGAIGLGALALWGDSQKDERGYLSTGSHRFAADTRALVTESLDIDLDGVQGIVDSSDLGNVRLDVEPQTDKPVFVGVARSDDVSSYLGQVSHTTVTDLEYEPFDAAYTRHAGGLRPAAPAGKPIWAASTQGEGPQTLRWDVEDGDWSVVVMNADGSPGVRADVSAGAKLPYLTEIGWGALGGGTILLLGAAVLVAFAVRPPRQRPRTATAGLAPSAG